MTADLDAAENGAAAANTNAVAARADRAAVDDCALNRAVEDADAGLGDDGADVAGKCCDRECAVDLGAADRNTARSSGNRALIVDVADKRLDVLEENAVKGGRQRSVVFDVA
jgi:hypothetical protein